MLETKYRLHRLETTSNFKKDKYCDTGPCEGAFKKTTTQDFVAFSGEVADCSRLNTPRTHEEDTMAAVELAKNAKKYVSASLIIGCTINTV